MLSVVKLRLLSLAANRRLETYQKILVECRAWFDFLEDWPSTGVFLQSGAVEPWSRRLESVAAF